jgi:hypothetical protein
MNILAGCSEPRAEVSADAAGRHNRDLHAAILFEVSIDSPGHFRFMKDLCADSSLRHSGFAQAFNIFGVER